jgi:glutathione synthase/RimK-type ligase-like ATP-grasp enzyme
LKVNNNKVAIIANDQNSNHSGSWTSEWVDYCEKTRLDFKVFSSHSLNIIEDIRDYNVLLWHFSGYNLHDMLIARSILYSAKAMGLKVFPDFEEAWHFDDKMAENYMLHAINAPIPKYYHFYTLDKLVEWLDENPQFPIVAKLKNGSGSNNVKLINDRTEAIKYGLRMFKKGFNSSPSIIFKASSNVRSAKKVSTFINRAKRIPEFLCTVKNAREFPKEHGYVLFQEVIPNDGYDLKIVVIGNKLSFIVRSVRKGDFRASGGGDLFFDKNYVTRNILETAFATNDALSFKCMGYDYIVHNKTGEAKIVETSYGFSHSALLQAGGYFDRRGNWYDVPLNAPKEILKNLLTTPVNA